MALASDLVPAVSGRIHSSAGERHGNHNQPVHGSGSGGRADQGPGSDGKLSRLQALQIATDQQKQRDATSLQIQQMLMDQQKADEPERQTLGRWASNMPRPTAKCSGRSRSWVLIVVGFFVALVGMLLYRSNIDPVVGTIINVLVGVLASNFTQVCNFWLGSSSGSAEKTRLLASSIPASMMPSPAAVVPAADVPNPNS